MNPADNNPTIEPGEFDETTVSKLVASFYRRVRSDELLARMYPQDDWSGAETRLRDFLIYRLGGSDRYIRERGHPRLGMRHARFKIGVAEKDRWLKLMNESIQETGLHPNEAKRLDQFFAHVAEFLRNQ